MAILVLEGARRDALWGIYAAGILDSARIQDRGAAERLAADIAKKIAPEDIEAVIVGTGPGSFTGLRIVLAFAKALAGARKIPLVGIDSLHAMQKEIDGPAVAILEAYAGQVFARGPNLASDVYDPPAIYEALKSASGVSDGPVPSLPGAHLIDLKEKPPQGLLALGLERLQRHDHDDPDTLLPNYARASSPELKMKKN